MKSVSKIVVPIISAAIVLLAAPCVSAEGILNKSAPSGRYGIEGKKIEYIGEKAAFSVDIPSGRADVIELSDSEIRTNGDGSSECDIFYGESDSGYISCVFHQSDSGFEGEAESWSESEDISLYNGLDADGQPYCVAEMNMYGFSAFIGEFPIGEDTWVNITMSFPENEMDSVRDDINTMMGSFTRINDSLTNDDPAEKSNENPATGESSLSTVVSVLMIVSAAIAFNAVKWHRR